MKKYLESSVVEKVLKNHSWLTKFYEHLNPPKPSESSGGQQYNNVPFSPEAFETICKNAELEIRKPKPKQGYYPYILKGLNEDFLDERIHRIFLLATEQFLSTFLSEKYEKRISKEKSEKIGKLIKEVNNYPYQGQEQIQKWALLELRLKEAQKWAMDALALMDKESSDYAKMKAEIQDLTERYDELIVDDPKYGKLNMLYTYYDWCSRAELVLNNAEKKNQGLSDLPMMRNLLEEVKNMPRIGPNNLVKRLQDILIQKEDLADSYKTLQKKKKDILQLIDNSSNNQRELLEHLKHKPTVKEALDLFTLYDTKKVLPPNDFEEEIAKVQSFWEEIDRFVGQFQLNLPYRAEVEKIKAKRKDINRVPFRDEETEQEFLLLEWTVDFKVFKDEPAHSFEELDSLYEYYKGLNTPEKPLPEFDELIKERETFLLCRKLVNQFKTRNAYNPEEIRDFSYESFRKKVINIKEDLALCKIEEANKLPEKLEKLSLVKVTDEYDIINFSLLKEARIIADEIIKLRQIGSSIPSDRNKMIPTENDLGQQNKITEREFQNLVYRVTKCPLILEEIHYNILLDIQQKIESIERTIKNLEANVVPGSKDFYPKLQSLLKAVDSCPVKLTAADLIKHRYQSNNNQVTITESDLMTALKNDAVTIQEIGDMAQKGEVLAFSSSPSNQTKLRCIVDLLHIKQAFLKIEKNDGINHTETMDRVNRCRIYLRTLRDLPKEQRTDETDHLRGIGQDLVSDFLDCLVRCPQIKEEAIPQSFSSNNVPNNPIVKTGTARIESRKTADEHKDNKSYNNHPSNRDRARSASPHIDRSFERKKNMEQPSDVRRTPEKSPLREDYVSSMWNILKIVTSSVSMGKAKEMMDYIKQRIQKNNEKSKYRKREDDFIPEILKELKSKMSKWSVNTIEKAENWHYNIRRLVRSHYPDLENLQSDNKAREKDKSVEKERSHFPSGNTSPGFTEKRRKETSENNVSQFETFLINVNDDSFTAYTKKNTLANRLFDSMEALEELPENEFFNYVEKRSKEKGDIITGVMQLNHKKDLPSQISRHMKDRSRVGKSTVENNEIFLIEKSQSKPQVLDLMISDLKWLLKKQGKEIDYELVFIIIPKRPSNQ